VWALASSGHDSSADAAREGEAAGREQAGTRCAAREPLMLAWIKCRFCGRLMHPKAKTCGNYCRWDELVGGR